MKSNLSLKNIQPDSLGVEEFKSIVSFVLSLPLVEDRKYDVDVDTVINNIGSWVFESSANSVLWDTESRAVVGVCLNSVQNQWWTSEPSLVNTITFISPEYRSASVFKEMLRNAEKYAKMKGMKFYFSPVACNKLDVKKRLLRRLGYTEVGAIMEAPSQA